MSVETKRAFIKNMTQKLSGTLTVDEMNTLTSTLAEELSRFTLEQDETVKTDIETKELLDEFLAAKAVEGKSPKTIPNKHALC